MNICVFSGRLTAEPDLHTFASGSRKVKFTVVVDRRYQDKDSGEWKSDPTFCEMEAWNESADRIVARNLKKGAFVHVEASIRTERWDDKNTGEKRSKIAFTCNRLETDPQGKKAEGEAEGGDEARGPAPEERPARGRRRRTEPVGAGARGEDIPSGETESEIPF